MKHGMLLAALLALPLALVGCRRSNAAEELGPASGQGAPPMPSMPALESSSSAEATPSSKC